MPQMAIVGAGLAGVLLAISLARRGYRVDVYERRPETRGGRVDVGRSINLALSARGAHALSRVGLLERVLAKSVPMRARAIHAVGGDIVYQPFGRTDSEYLASVDRHTLNVDLLDATQDYPEITLHFDQRLTGIDFSTMTLTFFDQAAQTAHERACESLVATDGAFSAARKIMIENGMAQFVQDELAYGYKELPIDAALGRDLALEVLHLWPRRSLSMIANPNPDHSFGCTLFMPHEGETSFAQLKTPEDVERLFQRYFPDALERMPDLAEHCLSRPTGRLPTVKGGPWYFEDKVVLLGDAAHALVPFFAQGMNSAFEDCTILADCLERCQDRRGEAYRSLLRGEEGRRGRHRRHDHAELPRDPGLHRGRPLPPPEGDRAGADAALPPHLHLDAHLRDVHPRALRLRRGLRRAAGTLLDEICAGVDQDRARSTGRASSRWSPTTATRCAAGGALPGRFESPSRGCPAPDARAALPPARAGSSRRQLRATTSSAAPPPVAPRRAGWWARSPPAPRRRRRAPAPASPG